MNINIKEREKNVVVFFFFFFFSVGSNFISFLIVAFATCKNTTFGVHSVK